MSNSFRTPWTVVYQAPLSMEFPRQEYWSGQPFPSPGALPDPEIKPASPALAGGFLYHWTSWEAPLTIADDDKYGMMIMTTSYWALCVYIDSDRKMDSKRLRSTLKHVEDREVAEMVVMVPSKHDRVGSSYAREIINYLSPQQHPMFDFVIIGAFQLSSCAWRNRSQKIWSSWLCYAQNSIKPMISN